MPKMQICCFCTSPHKIEGGKASEGKFTKKGNDARLFLSLKNDKAARRQFFPYDIDKCGKVCYNRINGRYARACGRIFAYIISLLPELSDLTANK